MPPSRSRQPSSLFSLSTLSALLLALSSRTALAFDCKDVMADGETFNFKSLGGPKLLHWEYTDDLNDRLYNHTFHLDICATLNSKKNGGCPKGAMICDVREDIDLGDENNKTVNHIPIAGTFTLGGGLKHLIDAKFNLLSKSGSNLDAEREGVRAELHGGQYPMKKNGREQMAIIEFVCDKEREGTEGDEEDKGENSPDNSNDDNKEGDDKEKEGEDKDKDKDKKEESKTLSKREGEGAGKCGDSDASLRFCGYGPEDVSKKNDKVNVLRLEWRTKYACRDVKPDDGGSHWGFFTWFIIILFLATAAYLIFGSWLNYNRYGARGWDLLPHGDTIRDIPYILKDWARRVAATIQGPGSRGGYSAV